MTGQTHLVKIKHAQDSKHKNRISGFMFELQNSDHLEEIRRNEDIIFRLATDRYVIDLGMIPLRIKLRGIISP